MTGTDLVETSREEAQAALAEGDTAAANEAYARELQARGGPPAPPATAPDREDGEAGLGTIPDADGVPVFVRRLPDEDVRYVFEGMARWNGWNGGPGTDSLREKWGADTAANLGYAEAFALANLDAVEVLEAHGLGNHPAFIEVAAILGRRTANHPGELSNPDTENEETMTEEMSETTDDFEAREAEREELDGIRAKIAEAQSNGDHKRANTLFQREQEIIARQRGSQPIVGRQGRRM